MGTRQKYVIPAFFGALALVMTVATVFIGVGSCNHKVTADVVSVDPLSEFGLCRVTLRYVAIGDVVETTKVMECSNGSTGHSVRACYRHRNRNDFFVYNNRRSRVWYMPMHGLVAMIAAVATLWLVTAVSFLVEIRHKGVHTVEG